MSADPCPQLPSPPRPSHPLPPERAQAAVEFVGTLPLVLLGAAACLQALLVAISLVFAQVAADRAARGASSADALAALPRPWRDRSRVQVDGGRAVVRVTPPAVLPGAGHRLAVRASSRVVS